MKKIVSILLILLILTSMVFALDHDDPRGHSVAPGTLLIVQQK